ncbi:P-loop containing nucleoside triphosphate hydrolase protein, partial [Dipodascopsis uninucleata]
MYVLTNDKPLTTDIVFPAMTLFNLLSTPLQQLPQAITMLGEASVSAARLTNFMNAPELQPDAVKRLEAAKTRDQVAVSIESGTFKWDENEANGPALKDINLTVKATQLACIVGRVGNGKSALLQAILGDMLKLSGRVTVRGHVAYCSQVPWIVNTTFKDNILFGKRFDQDFYERTIRACALLDDIAVLPDGDDTLVGEKGISLSGGQKARLALARAVYARADVYLLDDPLSAVDQHVGQHLIDNVFGPRGILASKTKIMATNAITVLNQADIILMLRKGEIVETGCYNDVVRKKNSELYNLISEFGHERNLVQDEETSVKDGNDTDITVIPPASDDSIAEITSKIDINDPLQRDDSDTDDATAYESDSQLVTDMRFYDHTLRRASTASFKKPSLFVDVPNRRSAQSREHVEQGNVKLSVYEQYLKAGGMKMFAFYFLLIFTANSLNVGGNLWLKKWSETNTEYGGNPDKEKFIGVYLGFGLGTGLFTLMNTVMLFLISVRAAKYLHDTMLYHVIRSPMSFFDTTPLGRIINRFTADINRIDDVIARVLTNFFLQTFKVVFSLFVITSSNPTFILFIIPLGYLYISYQKFYRMTSRELKRLESISRSPVYAHFQESLTGASTIRAYSQINRFNYTSDYHVDVNNQAYYASMISRRWLSIRLEFFGAMVIFLAALLSIIAVSYGRLSPGLVGLTMTYALQIRESLGLIVRVTVEVEVSTVSVERILEYSELPMEAPEVIEENRPPQAWPTQGSVEFHDYSTRYREGLDLVLKNIDLRIKPREKIGVVGRTGAGKSSLTLALFRIIEPVGGFIAIDRLNTNRIGLKDLRGRLAIIPQDSQAYEGLVRENIDPGWKHTDEELWRVLELSHLKTHVEQMEGKLYAKVQEGGSNFSVGQRQLMSLARALLTPSKILVLDEATAAVDVETDQIIQETIRKEFKDRTILTIAHRLNTIIDSDRIIVLSHGRVAEFDTPERLLADENSMFYALCKQGGLT